MTEYDQIEAPVDALPLREDDVSRDVKSEQNRRPLFVIEPTRGWSALQLRALWEYRELLYFFVWRDVKARYKQTALGAAWAILQPFLMMVAFSIFFGYLVQIESDGFPYPVFAYTALLPWQLFSNALTESGNSLVTHRDLLTKVYFPRLLLPLSAVLSGLVDFGVAFIVLLGMMYYYSIVPTAAILALPLFVVFACMTALAVSVWLAALNAQYRDVRYTISFLTQIWLFATPIVYPVSMIPEAWRPLYGVNPMVGVVEGFRWVLLGKSDALNVSMLVSVLVVVVLLVGGLYYFKRMEATLADVI